MEEGIEGVTEKTGVLRFVFWVVIAAQQSWRGRVKTRFGFKPLTSLTPDHFVFYRMAFKVLFEVEAATSAAFHFDIWLVTPPTVPAIAALMMIMRAN